VALQSEPQAAITALGAQLHWASTLPFVALLACIAVLPLAAPHWWEDNHHRAMVSGGLALPFAMWLYGAHGAPALEFLEHVLLDYLSFISVIGSLFVVAGGVHVAGSLAGTPLANTAMIGLGTLLANVVGTTGASMLLIRPLLRANESRASRVHIVVFFIFVVSNCGGLLTPLADPPLFLGFLRGVPFAWTLRLWREWLFVAGTLLLVFHIWDEVVLDREERQRRGSQLAKALEHRPLRIDGLHNAVPLAGIVLVIMAKGYGWGTGGRPWPFGIQELLMVSLAIISYVGTSRTVHRSNRFSFGPIIEVSILFAGIFVTMVAPLLFLNANGPRLGLREPWQYFWATGMLSGVLDNAPTYLAFAATAAGRYQIAVAGDQYLRDFLARGEDAALVLAAISCGAVFMGANTYIGNGPNFMVKAIAEENGVRMPSFFGYMAYSMAILIPIFLVTTVLFFR
jgi:Na+/H+ antiporter NhaD/arsenite permease-like protein